MNYFKKLRNNAGLTQKHVSRALGYDTPQHVANFENIKGIYPPLTSIKTIAKLYNEPLANITKYVVDAKCAEYRAELLEKIKL